MAIQFIAIGVSMGGTTALQILLPMLSPALPAAVGLVFHRGQGSDQTLMGFLQTYCRLPLIEPRDKTPIQPAHLYVAPADYHMLVEADHFAVSTEAPVSFARPSIDVLFESAAEVYKQNAACVVLTGTGHDGAAGLVAIKRHGGMTIVQSPASAESPQMPEAAIATGMVDHVLSIHDIASMLAKWQHK